GFMAQIVGLILLIVTSILILKHQSTDNVVTYWIKLLVLNFGIANSWYFLSPLAGLWLLREAIKNNLFKEKWFYLTSMVMGGLALYPIWMSIKSFNVVKEINAGGGIIGVKGVELLIMVVICIILRSRIKTVSKKLADVSFFTFTAASYPILLGIYGLIVKGSVAYYYNKSLYTVVIYLLALTVYLIFQRMSKVKILVKDNLYLILLTVVILGVSLLTKIGERNSLFRERKVFMDREVYNAMMVAKESGLDKQYYFVPFGRFIDLISFYTYFGYLPDFYKEKYPNVDYPGYPWIFEEVKSIKSDKPLMVFDAFTVKAEFSESQKAWLKQNEIKTYPLGVEIEGGN
ncbi:MAG: hypothetical protein NTY75_05155, partial [Candidatus Shapirobacteria bacterium]|nr:hypothetical protein [Candidatus Shapirobacteria bacterium]